jgi:hypothetical protein
MASPFSTYHCISHPDEKRERRREGKLLFDFSCDICIGYNKQLHKWDYLIMIGGQKYAMRK